MRFSLDLEDNLSAHQPDPAIRQADSVTDGTIPVENLLVIDGFLNGKMVKILKDDGCNTNVISRDFVATNKDIFHTLDTKTTAAHSKKGSHEEATQVVVDGVLNMGSHKYRSNWAVADCRYDVLLGMPWHVRHNPDIDYEARSIPVNLDPLPVANEDKNEPRICNIGVKKFRSLLRKKGQREDFQVFHLVEANHAFASSPNREGTTRFQREDDLDKLWSKYSSVFRDNLPEGLPPEREVDHAIEIDDQVKAPHRPLYQLSPTELLAVKDYVVALLQKGKIRRSKSPFGSSLFFVKDKNEPLRAVVDYRALNRFIKRNNSPLPRPDEMFDRLGGSCFFSKLDLKTGFHQIRVRPEDIEKTAFNTKHGQFEYLVMPMGLCNAPATF